MKRFDPLNVDIPALLAALGIEAFKAGEKWKARCPAGTHEDQDPSWDIRDQRGSAKHGTHHCFSCKFGGTATDLVMQLREYQLQSSAREFIQERAMGNPVPAWNVRVQMGPLRRTSFRLPREVVQLPWAAWLPTPQRYVEQRGITKHQVERWGIAYAVNGRLNGRIVFPTHNPQGQVVNYTARTFVGAPKRYLTPDREERPDFNVVYGERWWPAERRTLIITEGVINTLAVERCTDVPVACLNGSNPSLGQIARLATFQHCYVLTDQDYAGERADQQISDALARHTSITRVRLPTRCMGCGHELAEHVAGQGCRCCTGCRKWTKQDPASMKRDMLRDVLAQHGLPVLAT
jgi:DNA primase